MQKTLREAAGFITTYAFVHTGVECSITSSTFSYSATVTAPITVKTPDHTLTIASATWKVALTSFLRPYSWHASGGTEEIKVK